MSARVGMREGQEERWVFHINGDHRGEDGVSLSYSPRSNKESFPAPLEWVSEYAQVYENLHDTEAVKRFLPRSDNGGHLESNQQASRPLPSQGNQWRLAKSMDFHLHPAGMRIPSRTYMSASINRANEEPGFLYLPAGAPPSPLCWRTVYITLTKWQKSKIQRTDQWFQEVKAGAIRGRREVTVVIKGRVMNSHGGDAVL